MSVLAGNAELLERRRWALRGRGADRRTWAIALGVAVAASFAAAIDGRVLNAAGWTKVTEFATAAVSPETSPSFLLRTFNAAITTLGFAVVGSVVSVVIGLALGALVTRAAWTRRFSQAAPVSTVGRAVLSVPRALHEVVWGLLLVNVLGADPLVAVLAIGIPYGAITAKVFAEILDEAPQRGYLALRAAGASRPKAMLYGLLPQGAGDMVSYAFYRFECSIRAAAILGVIGAGGLGYELLLSFRTLRYDEMWTLIYALMALSGAVDLWSGGIRKRLIRGDARRFVRPSLAIVAILFTISLTSLEVDLSTLWSARTAAQLGVVGGELWPPALPATSWSAVVRATFVTLQMSVIAVALAAGAAAVAGAMSDLEARSVAGRAGRAAGKALLLLARAVPPPVWALLALFVLLPGVLPGAVALAIYNFGILGRLMAEAAENAPRAPTNALAAAGASRTAAWLYGTAPRLFPRFIALALYRWEVATRETVIVGLVGAGGLGALLSQAVAAFNFHAVAGVLIALVVVTVLVDAVSAQARVAFR